MCECVRVCGVFVSVIVYVCMCVCESGRDASSRLCVCMV